MEHGKLSDSQRPLRDRALNIYRDLKTERVSWDKDWAINAKFTMPRRPRFDTSRTNEGGRRNRSIVDGTSTRAVRTATAGMSTGITPAGRPWFVLEHTNRLINELKPVKRWLHETARVKRSMLTRSNFYQVVPSFYQDLLVFANSAILVDEDPEDYIRFLSVPVGSWAIANDQYMRPRTFYRELRLTVRQVVEKFCKKMGRTYDFSNVSTGIQNSFTNGNYNEWVDLVHIVCPNDEFKSGKLGVSGKKYLSLYMEESIANKTAYGDWGASERGGHFLRVSGYDYFPVLVGRWGLTSGDVYGSWCPTDIAIGDITELQYFARKTAEAVALQVNPPMKGGSRLAKKAVGRLPGQMTWFGDPKSSDSISRLYDFNFDIQHATELRQDLRNVIRESYYVDMFLRFSQPGPNRYLTAKQVVEEREEKVVELSPVLELLNTDVLNPLIDILFHVGHRRGLFSEAPEELQGEELKVEYTSLLHQSQKLLDAGALERFIGYVGMIAQAKPSALDKVDEDELVDQFGDVASVPPGIIRSDKDVAEIREARAEEEAKQERMDDISQGAAAAKDLSGAKTGDENLLAQLTG